ncbi:MAG: LysE family translocator [Alphaproteobacteria bacterium]
MESFFTNLYDLFITDHFFEGDWVNFIVFALVSSTTPGPNNSLLLNSGLRFGVRRSLRHLAGINIGFGLMFLFIGTIITFMPPQILIYLRWISIGLILYVAFKIATAPTDLDPPQDDAANEFKGKKAKPWGFWQAAAFQWINPKALMMAFAALAAYQIMPLAGAITFTFVNASCGIWLVAGAILRRYLRGRPLLTRIIFILMAAGLILTVLL